MSREWTPMNANESSHKKAQKAQYEEEELEW
jgi:hypothetical protein